MCDETKDSREYDLLIMQRKELIDNISVTNGRINTAIVMLVAGFITALIVKENQSSKQYETPMMVFVGIQYILLLAMYMFSLVTVANYERQQICAIDRYTRERWGVATGFYNGQLTKKYVMGCKGTLAIITTATQVVLVVALILSFFLSHYFETFMRNHIIVVLVTFVETYVFLAIVLYDFYKRVRNKDNRIEEACYKRLKSAHGTVSTEGDSAG